MKKIKKSKKQIGLYIFYGAITIFFLSLILSFQDIHEIFKVIATADPLNLLWAILLLFLYLALYPITTCLLIKTQKLKISQPRTYAIGMTEHFFNGITPFSTGGQPFQVYAFAQEKVKPEDSSGVLLMNFIIHMIATNLFAICALFYFPMFAANNKFMYIIAIVGFSINFAVLFFMIALATSKRLSNGIMHLLKKLCRFKWLDKFLTPKLQRVQDYFDNTQNAFKALWKNKKVFFSCLLIRMITMFVYYSLTFFILKALHIEIGFNQFFFVACGSSFAITMVVFLPTPGSSGGIEWAFGSILSAISHSSTAVAYGGMLIWRLLTYYFTMFVSLCFYVGLQSVQRRERKKRIMERAFEIEQEKELEVEQEKELEERENIADKNDEDILTEKANLSATKLEDIHNENQTEKNNLKDKELSE